MQKLAQVVKDLKMYIDVIQAFSSWQQFTDGVMMRALLEMTRALQQTKK